MSWVALPSGGELKAVLDPNGELTLEGFDETAELLAHQLTGGPPPAELLLVQCLREELGKVGGRERIERLDRMGGRPLSSHRPLAEAWLFARGNRASLAQHPYLPLCVQRALTQDPDPAVRQNLASSFTSRDNGMPTWQRDPEVLRQLALDPDHNVRWEVARGPMTPLGVRLEMCSDPNPVVRAALARWQDPELQRRLVSDHNPRVRRALAESTKLVETLALLSCDSDPAVLGAVAGSDYLTAEVRQMLPARGRHPDDGALSAGPGLPQQAMQTPQPSISDSLEID